MTRQYVVFTLDEQRYALHLSAVDRVVRMVPRREIVLTDRLIFAHMKWRPVALVADSVTGVVECSGQSLIPAEEILHEFKYLEGIIKFRDGLILIHDLDKFLSLEEEECLDVALDIT